VCDLRDHVKTFISRDDGLTTVEYAVAGALITVAVIGPFTNLGTAISATMTMLTGVING
jgi:pilus assembly protein Flp/PilA